MGNPVTEAGNARRHLSEDIQKRGTGGITVSVRTMACIIGLPVRSLMREDLLGVISLSEDKSTMAFTKKGVAVRTVLRAWQSDSN